MDSEVYVSRPAKRYETGSALYLQARRTNDNELLARPRLRTRLFALFHNACDNEDLEIARMLLAILDNLLTPSTSSTKIQNDFARLSIAAHERLWHLCHS